MSVHTAIIMGKAPSCNFVELKSKNSFFLKESNVTIDNAIVISLNEACELAEEVDYGIFVDIERVLATKNLSNVKKLLMPTLLHAGFSHEKSFRPGYYSWNSKEVRDNVYQKVSEKEIYLFRIYSDPRPRENIVYLDNIRRSSHIAVMYCIKVLGIRDFVFTGISTNDEYHSKFSGNGKCSFSNRKAYDFLLNILKENNCNYKFY
jgi:hypothetical protein